MESSWKGIWSKSRASLQARRLSKIIQPMFYKLHLPWGLTASVGLSGCVRQLILAFFVLTPLGAVACPDLLPYYPGAQSGWAELEQKLTPLMPECLESSEYYALFGAAQLNSGKVAESLEALERALLLDPNNGSAQIDYAQAHFLQGELFTALELNRRLLGREDLPATVQPLIEERQQSWQALTRQRGLQLDMLAGYDSNLNGAPDSRQITLTLSGDSIVLPLDADFQEIPGPYLNYRLAGQLVQLTPTRQHNFSLEVKGRISESKASDLLQLGTRYALMQPASQSGWYMNAGITQLFFGGSPLMTAGEGQIYYLPESGRTCQPFYSLTTQYQHYQHVSNLSSVESKASAGLNCPLTNFNMPQRLSFELGALNVAALQSGRPGGSRDGWQANAEWRLQFPTSEIVLQANFTRLDDRRGFSPLLENGSERRLDRSYIFLQYLRSFGPGKTLMFNLFHQNQTSNIDLFRSASSTAEIGIRLSL